MIKIFFQFIVLYLILKTKDINFLYITYVKNRKYLNYNILVIIFLKSHYNLQVI